MTGLVVLCGALGLAPVAVPLVGITGAAAQQRHVLVVSDSILLGAQGPLTAVLARSGWSVGFDGAVSRSTAAGADVVRARAGELTDSLVVSLGANDAGNAATFRQRVEAVMAAAGAAPNVYWLTIREVRPYYAPANQVLREAAARHPNLHLIDWNAWTAGRSDLTVGDGLHLTAAGAGLMGMVVAGTLTGAVPGAAPSAAPTSVAPPALPPPVPPPAPAGGGPAETQPAASTPPSDGVAVGHPAQPESAGPAGSIDRSAFVVPMAGPTTSAPTQVPLRSSVAEGAPGPWSWAPLALVVVVATSVLVRRRKLSI